jgi:hypothetical protein
MRRGEWTHPAHTFEAAGMAIGAAFQGLKIAEIRCGGAEESGRLKLYEQPGEKEIHIELCGKIAKAAFLRGGVDEPNLCDMPELVKTPGFHLAFSSIVDHWQMVAALATKLQTQPNSSDGIKAIHWDPFSDT